MSNNVVIIPQYYRFSSPSPTPARLLDSTTCYNKNVKKLLSGIAFILLLGLTLYGTNEPWNKDISQKVRGFTLKPYKFGLYISPTPGVFYNISPYDAYLKYTDGTTEKLVDTKEPTFAKEISNQKSLLQAKAEIIQVYFQTKDPIATFTNKEFDLVLKSKIKDNKIHIWVENLPRRLRNYNVVMTISFNESDFILSDEKKLYYPEGVGSTDKFKDVLGSQQVQQAEKEHLIPSTKGVVIVSGEYTGGMKINPEVNNYNSITLNIANGLIEVELQSSENEIVIEVFDSLEEIPWSI